MILAPIYIVGFMKDNMTKVLMDMVDIYLMKMDILRNATMDYGNTIERME
jgi:hypothetical protein